MAPWPWCIINLKAGRDLYYLDHKLGRTVLECVPRIEVDQASYDLCDNTLPNMFNTKILSVVYRQCVCGNPNQNRLAALDF